jgi:hypothetical protein
MCFILLGSVCVFNNAVLRCTLCTDRAADRSVAGCAAGVSLNLSVSTDRIRRHYERTEIHQIRHAVICVIKKCVQ